MKTLNKFIGIGFAVLTTEVAEAVSLSDCAKDGATITIGVNASFSKYEGWIPWLKPYANQSWGTDQKAVIWKNRRLSEIKGLTCKMSGAWMGGIEFVGRGLITSRTDEKMEVQFQVKDGSANKAVLAYLEQSGDDIVIWGRNAGYIYNTDAGTPIPNANFNMQVSSAKDNGAYGVYDVEVLNVLETTPTELKSYAATVGDSGTDTLQVNEGTLVVRPTQTNDVFDLNVTGNANVYFGKGDGGQEVETLSDGILQTTARTILPGLELRGVEIVSAKTGGSWMGIGDAQIFHLQEETGKVTFQAQKQDSGWTKCVLVELTDGEKGIDARIVWGRYKAAAYCPMGSDFSNLEGYNSYSITSSDMQSSLSSLVLKVEPTLVFASSKSSWTTWGTTFDGGIVRVTNAALPVNPLTFVANGGSLRLEVAGGAWYGGDSRQYVVLADSELVLAEGVAMASGSLLTLDGGSLRMLNGFNYVNDLVITNGGGIIGSTTCRAGYAKDVTWNIYGTDPVTIEPGIELVNNGSKTVTLNAQAETFLSGSLKDASGYGGTTFAKDGSATLTLGSENYNSGPFKVVAGKLVFASAKGIKANNAVILGGGMLGLSQGNDGVSAGTLTLDGSAALDATNGTFSFADSHEATWADGAVLTLTCGATKKERKNRFRFGTDANGLTAAQLAAICYDSSVTTKTVTFSLDSEGYLKDNLDAGFVIRIR